MTHAATKTATTPGSTPTRDVALAAMCYEYAVLQTRAQTGIRLPAEDRLALSDLSRLLTAGPMSDDELTAFPVSIPARVHTNVLQLSATVVAVSGGGLLLTAWSGVRPGTIITVRITDGARTLSVSGTVRWSEPRGGRISLGVEFAPVPIGPEPLLEARRLRQRLRASGSRGPGGRTTCA